MTRSSLVLSIVAILVLRRHAHRRIDRRRWCRAVRSSSRPRVVLASAPAKTNSRIADRVALHLVDGHLSSMSLNELHETATLSRRDLDVGDLAKALEERAKLILGNVARQTTDEDSGIVGIGELIHRLRLTSIVGRHRRLSAHLGLTHLLVHLRRIAHWSTHHRVHATRSTLVLGCSSADAHRSIATVDALHLFESTPLVLLIGEAHEAVATRHAGKGISHDLRRLAGWES